MLAHATIEVKTAVSPRRNRLPVRQRREPVGPWGRYVNDVLVRKALSYRRAYEPINDAAQGEGERCVNYGRHSIRNWVGGVLPHADALRWIAAGWNEPIERVSAEAEAHRRWRYEQRVQASSGDSPTSQPAEPPPCSPLLETPELVSIAGAPKRPGKTATLWRPADVEISGAFTPDDEERITLAVRRPMRIDAGVVDSLDRILAAQRRTEDAIGSAPLIRPVTAQLATIEDLVVDARGSARSKVADTAAQWAEFAGWLHTSTGRWREARMWFDRASEWAMEAGNATLIATSLSFKGHLAFLLGQVGPMVGLTQAAQRNASAWVGQRAYDAHQEARGLALLGDVDAAVRKVDEGTELAAHADGPSDERPPWTYYYTASFYALERGLAYRFLGRHSASHNDEAIASLTAALADVGEARSSEWLGDYLYHLAVAYMRAGAPDKACETAMEVVGIVHATESVRLSQRLRVLSARLVQMWPDDPHVTQLGEVLAASADRR